MNSSELAKKLTEIDIKSLCETGQVFLEGQSAYYVTFKLVPDECTQISDFDSYGQVAWARSNSHRPEGFDGAAQILLRGRHENLWWQPYKDEDGKIYNSQQDFFLVRNLAEFGFYQIELKLYGPLTSIIGTTVGVIAQTTLCGIDTYETEVASEYIRDMINDWTSQLENA
jgi:hypothetical protein